LWRAEALIRWPAQTGILALLCAAAFAWLIAECLWPIPGVAALDIPNTSGQPAVPRTRQSVDTSTFIQTFGSRKLFIPVVPVEQYELSGEVVDEMGHLQ